MIWPIFRCTRYSVTNNIKNDVWRDVDFETDDRTPEYLVDKYINCTEQLDN